MNCLKRFWEWSGCYAIVCVPNGKRYIGATEKFYNRCYQHGYRLDVGTHTNKRLQADWKKYGRNAFRFEILERNGEPARMEDEGWLIAQYDSASVEKGYNLSSYNLPD